MSKLELTIPAHAKNMPLRDQRQAGVSAWAVDMFGPEQALNPRQRMLRLAEEVIELAQALDVPASYIQELITYVYSRPPGHPYQELGGVGVTLLALAEAMRFSADIAEQAEIERALSMGDKIKARNKHKNELGFQIDAGPTLMGKSITGPMAKKALLRPADFYTLDSAAQWAIDKALGILDWDGTPDT